MIIPLNHFGFLSKIPIETFDNPIIINILFDIITKYLV